MKLCFDWFFDTINIFSFFKKIYELRALYHAVYTHQTELKAKKSRKGSVDKKSSAGSESGENFLDENLTEAYTILDTLRKALDDVKDTW